MSYHRKWASWLALVLIVATVLSACGPAPAPEVVEKVVTQVVHETVVVAGTPEVIEKEVTKVVEVEVTPVPEPQEVKQIVMVEGTAPKTMDPYRGISTPEIHFMELMFQGLVDIDYDRGVVVPDLAESWEIGDDQLTWTFKLKKGLKFSDGTDVNAEAVKYSLDLMSDEEFSHVFYNQFSVIQDVEVVDDYTVRFKTETPFAPLLINLAHHSAAIVSPTAREAYGEDFTMHPVGSGPYQLQSWEGDTLVLERNPYYTGKPTWFDEIKYLTVPEGGARVAMLETGEADIVVKIPPQDVERLQANPGLRVDISPSLYTISLEVNTTKPPLDDPR
ncbi:MAG: ABC transporter substrate-binding protein, partial [Anaerolineae bacterium]